MNSSSDNQPRPAAVEQGALPALPAAAGDITGIPGASPQHYEDGYTADQMAAHARAAWNMGLDAGLLHAPAVTETGLPELRDHLATAKVTGNSITLSPAAAGALHLAMTTPPPAPAVRQAPGLADWASYMDGPELQELKAEALNLAAGGSNWRMDVGCMFVLAMIERIESRAAAPKVAGYIEPQEIPCIGQCRTTLWATKQSPDAFAVFLEAPADKARIAELEAEVTEWMKAFRDSQDILNTIGRQLGGRVPEQLVSEIARERMQRIAELEGAIDKLAACKGRFHTEANFKALMQVREKQVAT